MPTTTLSRRIVTALAFAGGLSAMVAIAVPDPAAADGKDIAQALRAGVLVIVVRHGATFPDQADTDPLNFDNIAAQRNLNDKSKALAKTTQTGDGTEPCVIGHRFEPGPIVNGHPRQPTPRETEARMRELRARSKTSAGSCSAGRRSSEVIMLMQQ